MIKHNYIAIITMIIAHMVIGALWYGALFSDLWAREALGKTVAEIEQQPMSMLPYVFNVLGAAFTCFFLSWLVHRLKISSFSEGLKLGFYASLGLVFPSIVSHYLFLGLSNIAIAIDCGLTTFMVMLTSGVLAAWRKKNADDLIKNSRN